MIVSLIILFLGFNGYFIIIFGGGLIVDEEQLILDETTIIETTEGKMIGKLYNENRIFISIEEIPDHVLDAFVAVEDTRFFQHSGVDMKAIFRALYRDIIAFSKVEGASTITQQLAKNLFLTQDKTWMRKTKEAMAAIYLERHFSKKEILELYVNAVYFGHGVYGIETAAQKFFSKSAKELTVTEGALLAGIVRAPNYYSPIRHPERALDRRNIVLKVMENQGLLRTEDRLQLQGKTLGLHVQEGEQNTAYQSYIDLVMKEAAEIYQISLRELKRGGYRIIVSMDEEIQKIAYQYFQQEDYFPGNTDGVEGAFVMMDHRDGKIVAVLGGRNYTLGHLNRATVKRQPGSTFKPIAVYGPAFMKEDIHPYTLIPDDQKDFGGYSVVNADGRYEGSVSIFEAIKRSKNTSAVWLLDHIGIDYAKSYLQRMNIDLDDQGLSIALGGLREGVTPIEITASYRTFVQEGKYIEPYTIQQIHKGEEKLIFDQEKQETEVFSPQVAWDMTKILQETVEAGTASFGEYTKALAGKTGSTEHLHVAGKYKDAWFVGYTPEYVITLWMGYDRSDADHYLEGGSMYPTTLTKEILTAVDQTKPLANVFIKPENIVELPDPIELGPIEKIKAKYTFGGFPFIKGKLSWDPLEDKRIIYRIYEQKENGDKRIGEVRGEDHFVIEQVSLFQTRSYYIVPYDPLTEQEGDPSPIVELKW